MGSNAHSSLNIPQLTHELCGKDWWLYADTVYGIYVVYGKVDQAISRLKVNVYSTYFTLSSGEHMGASMRGSVILIMLIIITSVSRNRWSGTILLLFPYSRTPRTKQALPACTQKEKLPQQQQGVCTYVCMLVAARGVSCHNPLASSNTHLTEFPTRITRLSFPTVPLPRPVDSAL